MSNAAPSWQSFKSLSTSGCPKLFYRFHSNKDGLEMLLTDMVGIWSCQRTREEVVTQANEVHCGIDPSESDSQFQVLLSKLQQSLAIGRNHLGVETKGQDFLVLRTRIELPAPLKPLVWIFDMTPRGASEMAEWILQPCQHELSLCYRKLDSLQQIIKDKDHVIMKLLDRISNAAIDLTLIFPSITGRVSRRGQVTVDEAKKHVAGMAGFDLRKWSTEFEPTMKDAKEVNNLKTLVVGKENCTVHTRAEHESWVSRLPDPEHIVDESSQSRRSHPALLRSNTSRGDVSQNSEAAFERQPTPPNLRSNKRLLSDSDSPSPVKKPKTRLGALRSKRGTESSTTKDASRSRSSSSPSPQSKHQKQKRGSNSTSTSASATTSSPEPALTRAQAEKRAHANDTDSEESDHAETRNPTATQAKAKKSPSNGRNVVKHKPSKTPESSSSPASKPKTQTQTSRKVTPPNPDSETDSSSDHDSKPKSKPTLQKTDSITTNSNLSTPSRRLGRLNQRKQTATPSSAEKKKDVTEQSNSKSKSKANPNPNSPSPTPRGLITSKSNHDRNGNRNRMKSESDTDTETATDSSPSTPTPSKHTHPNPSEKPTESKETNPTNHSSGTTTPSSSSSPSKPTEPPKEKQTAQKETMEQRADRRREELRKTLHGNNNNDKDENKPKKITELDGVQKKDTDSAVAAGPTKRKVRRF